MKKVVLFSFVLTLCLLVSSFTLAADTKPKKCTYPAGVEGTMEFPGRGFKMWETGDEITITVLEQKAVPYHDPEVPNATKEYYRFNAEYDNPIVMCPAPGHTTHEFKDVKSGIPEIMWDNFLLPVEDAKCK